MLLKLKIKTIDDFYDKIFNHIIEKGKRKEINGLTYRINEYIKLIFKNNKFFIHTNNKIYILCRIFMHNKNISLISLYLRSYSDNIGENIYIISRYLFDTIYEYLNINIKLNKFRQINCHYPYQYYIDLKPIKKIFTCPITLNKYKNGYISKCGHIFNKNSILQWLEFNECCPVCRKIIKFKGGLIEI